MLQIKKYNEIKSINYIIKRKFLNKEELNELETNLKG
jgi:hypothetical protein